MIILQTLVLLLMGIQCFMLPLSIRDNFVNTQDGSAIFVLFVLYVTNLFLMVKMVDFFKKERSSDQRLENSILKMEKSSLESQVRAYRERAMRAERRSNRIARTQRKINQPKVVTKTVASHPTESNNRLSEVE